MSASPALIPSPNGGQAGNRNALKKTEKMLKAYTWATGDTVDQELTVEELVEVRAQRIKLKKAIHQLKGNDPRRPQAENCLEILDRRIVKGAKRQGRHTEKSKALDEAKAQLQVCEEQQDSVEEVARREMARHQKAMAKIFEANRCNYDELTSTAGTAIQTGLELQYGDPDKELENELDLQDECKRTACKRSAAELGEPTVQSKRREFKKMEHRLQEEAGVEVWTINDEFEVVEALSAKLPRALVEEKHYYPQFLTPEGAEALKECLVAERAPYLVKYNEAWRSSVKSRPKCNMAEPVDGKWPAYKWGQVNDDLPLIEIPPPLVQNLARRLEAHFGHPRGFLNSPMATYYFDGKNQYLVNHQDKSHSCESTGKIESAAPIYNLSLGAPRNFVIANLNSLGKTKRADMQIYMDIRMLSGDLVVLSPRMNMELCHGVPEEPEAPAGLRISLVFRHCTKYWIRQLHDNTWELCQRSASGKDGAWTRLAASKDGESDDIEARLLGRRQHAAAVIEGQPNPKRARVSSAAVSKDVLLSWVGIDSEEEDPEYISPNLKAGKMLEKGQRTKAASAHVTTGTPMGSQPESTLATGAAEDAAALPQPTGPPRRRRAKGDRGRKRAADAVLAPMGGLLQRYRPQQADVPEAAGGAGEAAAPSEMREMRGQHGHTERMTHDFENVPYGEEDAAERGEPKEQSMQAAMWETGEGIIDSFLAQFRPKDAAPCGAAAAAAESKTTNNLNVGDFLAGIGHEDGEEFRGRIKRMYPDGACLVYSAELGEDMLVTA